MTATYISHHRKWRETPILPVLLIIAFLFLLQNHGLEQFLATSAFAYVDTLSEHNWTEIDSSRVSLRRVHRTGLLHQKVWILPFDEMWHLGLSSLPESEMCNGVGAVETHVTSGSSVALVASQTATRLKRGRRAAPLQPLGRPFLFEDGTEREIIHVFALSVQGVFPERSHKWFPRVVKPVQFIQEGDLLLNSSVSEAAKAAREQFCIPDRLNWLIRSVSYAMRRLHLKGFIPKSNPMDNARQEDPICCTADVDVTEDLMMCGLKCDEPGLYNIISQFPQAR